MGVARIARGPTDEQARRRRRAARRQAENARTVPAPATPRAPPHGRSRAHAPANDRMHDAPTRTARRPSAPRSARRRILRPAERRFPAAASAGERNIRVSLRATPRMRTATGLVARRTPASERPGPATGARGVPPFAVRHGPCDHPATQFLETIVDPRTGGERRRSIRRSRMAGRRPCPGGGRSAPGRVVPVRSFDDPAGIPDRAQRSPRVGGRCTAAHYRRIPSNPEATMVPSPP